MSKINIALREKMNKALLIGINYTGSRHALNGCINDVENVREYLGERFRVVNEVSLDTNRVLQSVQKVYNFRKTAHQQVKEVKKTRSTGADELEILVLTDDKEQKPTRANILAAFKWLVKGAKQGDRLYVHYSGHGSQVRDLNGDEPDGRDECLCPLDYNTAGMIIDDDVRKCLINPLPKGSQLRCIFDCCHSGTMTDTKYIYKNTASFQGKLQGRKDARQLETKADVIAWSGCRDDQTSSDAYISGKFAGALTATFLEILRDPKQDRSYSALYERLTTLLKQRKYAQKPQLTSGKAIDVESRFDLF